jgi:cytochrome c553
MNPLSPEMAEMRGQASTITPSRVFAILVVALLAAALTGCGVGRASNEEKINKTASTYLRALADGDTAEACAQLTRRAKGERCESAMKERLPRLDSDALKNAADGSIDVEIDGDRATAGLSEPEGARFLLAKVGAEWRIDSGYTLDSGI